jgi:hypothetical protein
VPSSRRSRRTARASSKEECCLEERAFLEITASPRIFEEGDNPMKKATNEQLGTVIYYLGSIDCIFCDRILRNFITLVEKWQVEAVD